jgi:branched-chain amino acid transport system substrate-binding protein
MGATSALAALTLVGSATASGAASSGGGTVNIMLEGAITGPVYALPEMVTGAQAAVATLNASGGVDGHKVNLIVCDDQGNPNLDASCGREAVADHVVAEVGSLSEYDNDFIPVLESAKIPYFGSTDINAVDHTASVSFPIVATVTDWTGMGHVLGAEGCKDAAAIGVNGPGTSTGLPYLSSAFKRAGGKTFKQYEYPPTASVFNSYVATATAGGAKCIAVIGGPQAIAELMTAIKSTGQKIPIVADLDPVVPSLFAPIHFPAGEMKVVGGYIEPDTGSHDAGANKFAAAVNAQHATGEAGSVDELSENSYQGVLMFAQDAKGVSDLTGPNLLAAIPKNMSNVNTGLTPSFSLAKTGVFKGYPQDRDNHEVVYSWNGTGLQQIQEIVVSPAS